MVTLSGTCPVTGRDVRHAAGLVGADILGSLSPALHEREAAECGLRYVYLIFDIHQLGIDAHAADALVDAARRLGFCGLNITHPCKQLVIEHLDELSHDARAIGAVNTVVFAEGRAIGHNTDWFGFREGLRRSLPEASADEVVVLGAGGAGAAATYALLGGGARHVTVIDADEGRARRLASRLVHPRATGSVSAAPLGRLARCLEPAAGLVQATPVGMSPRGGMPVDPAVLRPSLWVYDIVYRPLETELLRRARALGCPTVDGGAMAVLQAAEALRLFTGVQPDSERMLAHLAALENREEQP